MLMFFIREISHASQRMANCLHWASDFLTVFPTLDERLSAYFLSYHWLWFRMAPHPPRGDIKSPTNWKLVAFMRRWRKRHNLRECRARPFARVTLRNKQGCDCGLVYFYVTTLSTEPAIERLKMNVGFGSATALRDRHESARSGHYRLFIFVGFQKINLLTSFVLITQYFRTCCIGKIKSKFLRLISTTHKINKRTQLSGHVLTMRVVKMKRIVHAAVLLQYLPKGAFF